MPCSLHPAVHDKGKPGESRGRKATGLPERYAPTVAGPPNESRERDEGSSPQLQARFAGDSPVVPTLHAGTLSELMLKLLERVCREVSRLWQRLAFRSYASPQAQLAFAIQTLSELRLSNGNLPDKADLDLPLNETKLSDFLGVSERSVARHLKRLESRDTVDYQRGRLSVLDRARLRRLAESN